MGYNSVIMQVKAVKTRLVQVDDAVEDVIAESISDLAEGSVLVIASKIFSFAENRLVPKKSDDKAEKWELAKKEANYWIDPNKSKYQCMLTIKGGWVFANGGIDESNSEGNAFTLWPKNPQHSVNQVWRFLRQHYGVKKVGVIMSDSSGIPLNWGVISHGIAHCGFKALKSYIGKPDLYGRIMQMERVNMTQSIVVAGTLEMGEGAEQTPIAVVTGVRDLEFQEREPTEEELEFLKISMEDDIYAPMIETAPWKKGGMGK